MELHPREAVVQAAKTKFADSLLRIEHEYELTMGEVFSILAGALSQQARTMVEYEREGDDDE